MPISIQSTVKVRVRQGGESRWYAWSARVYSTWLVCFACAACNITVPGEMGDATGTPTTSPLQPLALAVTADSNSSEPTGPTGRVIDSTPAIEKPPTGLNRYTLVGRFDTTDPNGPRCAMLNSRVGVSFTGTSLSLKASDTGQDYLTVVVDGNTLPAPLIIGGNKSLLPSTYAVVEGLNPGNHTVWLLKRTEGLQNGQPLHGHLQIWDMTIDPNEKFLSPPPKRSRRIDFVGDSGFVGHGAGQTMGGPNQPYCDWTLATQNGLKSVPGYTGAWLNADIVNSSTTGEAVYLSFYDPTNPSHNLPVIYEETLPPDASPAWNFATDGADVVVLHAGGNDLWGNGGNGYFPNPANRSDPSASDPSFFVNAYADWLVKIRSHYPKALIVSVLSAAAKNNDTVSLGNGLRSAIAQAQTRGVTNVVYYSYFTDDPLYHTYDDVATKLQLYYGCQYHTSAAGAMWLSQRLASFIAGQMKWDPIPAALAEPYF